VCNLATRPGIAVFGFARDDAGELYVLGNRTGVVSGSTGVVEMLTLGCYKRDLGDRDDDRRVRRDVDRIPASSGGA
jgi:hypothetical protein